MVPFIVLRYSQYCSNDLMTKSGVVALEKLIEATSKFGSFRKALNKVIVFPEPGGPHKITGRCSDIQEYNTSSCRTVSIVGMTVSAVFTSCGSTSRSGTTSCQGSQVEEGSATLKSRRLLPAGTEMVLIPARNPPKLCRISNGQSPAKLQMKHSRSLRDMKCSICS